MVKPRLDIQDRPESRFFLSSYLFAQNLYRDTQGLIDRGITQIAKDDKEARRYDKLVQNQALPPAHFCRDNMAISFPMASIIEPKIVIGDLCQDIATLTAKIDHLKYVEGQWQALDAQGQVIAQNTIMIIASGAGVKQIKLPDGQTISDALALRFSRGQLSWAKGDVTAPMSYGGYAIPMETDNLIGATHDRVDWEGGSPYDLHSDDDQRNLEQARQYLGDHIVLSDKKGRASLRVTTATTLPYMDEILPGLWIITGLGSRGFSFAPLLAEDMIMRISGGPAALTPAQRARFSVPSGA